MSRRTALIIGASSPGGLGEAAARRLATDGFALILAGRDLGRLKELASELGAQTLICDVLDERSIEALAAQVCPVDVLVNASGATLGRSIAKISRDEIESQLAMHVTANVLLFKHFAPAMPRGGSIVLFSSVVARLPGHGIAAYSAAKAALEQLVRVAALEFGPLGIRVNAVAPGFTRTPMTESLLSNDRLSAFYRREALMGELTEPRQVAAAVSYLAEVDCYTTGEIIQVSGGAQLGRLPRLEEIRT